MSLDVNISEPEEFNSIQLHSCIKEVAKVKGIEEFEYHVDYIYGKGDNYIANIFRVLLKETGKDDDSVSVIVKTLVNTTRQELFHELHKREVMVYEEVIPKFKLLQNSLEDKDKVKLPECLFSRSDKGSEILILEDLLIDGFEMDDKLARYENLDYNQVSLVVTELAKFHALSFVLEKKQSEDFTYLQQKLQDVIFQDYFLNKSKLRSYFFDSFNMSLKVITDLNARKKLEKLEPKILNILKKFMEPRKHNTFCHGDCWINNMLFKHEENKPSQICLLDFQAMRYASPVTDIIYFLYTCTDSKLRSDHFEDLQNIYYENLKLFLGLYKINVSEVYPRLEFENDMKEYLPFGLLIALIELRIITNTAEDEDVLKGSNIVPGINTSQVPGEANLFIARVNDVVNESIENGVLGRLIEK